MKKSFSTVISLCLYSLASNSYGTVNIQGTYSGIMDTQNTNCRVVASEGAWSVPIDLVIEQDGDDISSQPFAATDPLVGINTSYSITSAEATRDGSEAIITGTIFIAFDATSRLQNPEGLFFTINDQSSFTGTAGTDFANASFSYIDEISGCTKNSRFSLVKTAGPRTGENNTAADAVQQAFSAGDTILQASDQQRNNVKTRINTLKHRLNRPTGGSSSSQSFLDTSQFNVSFDGQSLSIGRLQNMIEHELSGGGASADDSFGLDSGFGIFINGNVDFGDRKSSVNQQGYDNDGAGVTIGADYRFTDNFFMGLAVGYNSNDTEYESNRGELSSSTYSAIVYATYNQPAGYFFDTVLRYGHSTFEGERNFNTGLGPVSPNLQEKALSDYDANDYSIELETGYEFVFKGLSIQPYAGASVVYGEVNSYQEAAGSANTAGFLFGLEKQRVYSAQTIVGADLSYVINTRYAVLIPRFNFAWHHDFLNEYPRIVDSYTLGQQSTTTVTVFSDTPDADFYKIGGGVSATLPYGISSFVNYSTLLSTRYITSHNINFGLRWSF